MTAFTANGTLRPRTLLASAACAVLLSAAPAVRAVPLTLYAAGSLTAALTTVASVVHGSGVRAHKPLPASRRSGRMGRAVRAVCGRLALLALLLASLSAAHGDTLTVLSGLVGRSKAELVQRLGPPSDTVTTIDGERLFYETLDAGQIGGRSGQDTRAGDTTGIGSFSHTYSFRCRTEVVVRNGRVAAFNRSGNDCR